MGINTEGYVALRLVLRLVLELAVFLLVRL